MHVPCVLLLLAAACAVAWASGPSLAPSAVDARAESAAAAAAHPPLWSTKDNCPDLPHRLNGLIQHGYCAYQFAIIRNARGIITSSANDVLVVEKGRSSVVTIWDSDGDGYVGANERATIASATGLDHGIALSNDERYLYASSAHTVYRWVYTLGAREPLSGFEVVVKNIPCCHHITRGLAFDASGTLYVQVGSGSNVDPDDSHARIHLFDVDGEIPDGGFDFFSGKPFATGLRNEVGFAFDRFGRLWGVENGVDDLARNDLGGDIHKDNPGEELNLLAQNEDGTPGFYGYPYCWSAKSLHGIEEGTQMAQPEFMPEITDEWCQEHSIPPKMQFDAHQAPLDIIFLDSDEFGEGMKHDAFVPFHGSWDRRPAIGYTIERVIFDESGEPIDHYVFLKNDGALAYTRGWVRPVSITPYSWRGGQAMLFTSDSTSEVLIMAPIGLFQQ
eukprot:TRINITY_DN1323_c0_g1_i1.p1 TRINITY_DN1323_c0_g1~~TRINITY_DN1323_c0_g1_i1.p1  ORF type:complete len:445 (-),score=108.25 TRINITY_DN1323_c0_g1_i1:365-1699(-)